MEEKHSKGQYFTEDESLRNTVHSLIFNKPKEILEPSCGRGDLVDDSMRVKWDLYEIDTKIKPITKHKIIFKDFTKTHITKKYKTIIGNPPFVSRPKQVNLYIEFIERCYNLLDKNGELIFIIPSNFFQLSSASSVLKVMYANGTFTHLFYPHKENLFKNAAVDVVIFRYEKGMFNKFTNYNGKKYIHSLTNGSFTVSKHSTKGFALLGDYFMMTSGVGVFKEKENKKCILVKQVSRKKIIAIKGNLNHYRKEYGIVLIPKKRVNLDKVVKFLNSKEFRINYTYAGRFLINIHNLVNTKINII